LEKLSLGISFIPSWSRLEREFWNTWNFPAANFIFFIGEEQPAEAGRMYAQGRKAYHMANLVLDVAEKSRCCRIYTSGAAVALTHHTIKPRVWAVPNSERLIPEIRGYKEI